MPNHVTTEMIFRNVDAEKQAEILANVFGKNGEVDFQTLIPLPLNIWWGSCNSENERAFKVTALDWCTENWGTKWNAYQQREIVKTKDSLTLCFDTAWSIPYPWFAAVFNKLHVSFEYNSLNEGESCTRSGYFDQSEMEKNFGKPWAEKLSDDETHRRIHKIKWGVEEFNEEEESND